jgi:hypothetical protein
MKSVYERNYERILALVPDIDKRNSCTAFKLKSPGYMDLSIEVLRRDEHGRVIISMTHYGEQNGDLMADPDMEIALVPQLKAAEALTWRNDYVGINRVVYPEPGKVIPKLKAELNDFLAGWLENIAAQGHKLDQQEAA